MTQLNHAELKGQLQQGGFQEDDGKESDTGPFAYLTVTWDDAVKWDDADSTLTIQPTVRIGLTVWQFAVLVVAALCFFALAVTALMVVGAFIIPL